MVVTLTVVYCVLFWCKYTEVQFRSSWRKNMLNTLLPQLFDLFRHSRLICSDTVDWFRQQSRRNTKKPDFRNGMRLRVQFIKHFLYPYRVCHTVLSGPYLKIVKMQSLFTRNHQSTICCLISLSLLPGLLSYLQPHPPNVWYLHYSCRNDLGFPTWSPALLPHLGLLPFLATPAGHVRLYLFDPNLFSLLCFEDILLLQWS